MLSKRIHKKSMKNIAYEKIKAKIISGEFSPGSSLSEIRLAEDIGISRTPIREAILMLESEDLVRIYPNKGPIVTEMSLDDFVYISQIREGLEGIAARVACDMDIKGKEKLSDIKLKLLALDNLQDLTQRELSFKYGREIHDIIMASTKNERMIKIVDNMVLNIERIMVISRLANQREEITHKQHIKIIDAILARDYDEAEKQMRNHIQSVLDDAMMIYRHKYI